MLDLETLNALPPHTVFATGITKDPRLHRDYVLRWVAVKGGVCDWAIYYHKSFQSIEFVCREGDKCFTKEVIKELVPCTDEVYKAYRF